MLIVTTDNLCGFSIEEYFGVVSAEVVLGLDSLKEFGAGFKNMVGGRVNGYEREVKIGKEMALNELSKSASDKGGNAVVGASFDVEFIKMDKGNMILISCQGTSCKTKKLIKP